MIIIGRPALQRLRHTTTSTGDHHFGALGCIVAQASGSAGGQLEFEEFPLQVDCDHLWAEPPSQEVLSSGARFGAERRRGACCVGPAAGVPALPPGSAKLGDFDKKEVGNGDSSDPEPQLKPDIPSKDDASLEQKGQKIGAGMIPNPEVGVVTQADALGPGFTCETPAQVTPCEESTGGQKWFTNEVVGFPMGRAVEFGDEEESELRGPLGGPGTWEQVFKGLTDLLQTIRTTVLPRLLVLHRSALVAWVGGVC